MLHKALLGVGLAVLTTGCPLLDLEAEVKEVCLTYPNVEVAGVAGATSLTRSFVFDDLGGIRELLELDSEMRFVRAEVRATRGISHFQFVDSFHATISSGDPESALPQLTAYDCTGDCVPEGSSLEVPASVQADAVEYVKSDSILVDMAFTGQMPAESWAMDVDICMSGRIAYRLDP